MNVSTTIKCFFKVLAFVSIVLGVGALVLALALLVKYDMELFLTPTGVWKDTTRENWMPVQWVLLAFGSGMFGVILAALGVLGTKLRYLWIGWLVIGICYCLLITMGIVYTIIMQPSEWNNIGDYLGGLAVLLLFSLPGITSIILGLMIHKPQATT